MKGRCNDIIAVILIMVLLPGVAAIAQKKKKGSEEVQANADRSREAEFYFTEGEKFFILEDYAKALTYYQKTLEIAPGNATVHYKIAEVLAQNNRPEDMQKAVVSIENALRLEKKNKYFYLLAANIYSSLARFDKAAEMYETMIAQIPGNTEYLYELGAVYQFAGKWDDAFKTYQKAETLMGISEASSLQKQRILVEQNKVKEAVAEGEKLIQAFPGDERILMGFTEMLSQQGLKSQAIRYLEEFSAENPEAFNTKMLLAAFYRENNQEDKARPILLTLFDHPDVDLNSKLLILGAYNAELNIARSQQRVDLEKFSFAEKLFRRLLSATPDEPRVHVIGGDLFLTGGKLKDAHDHYLKAIAKGDVTYEVWENMLLLEYQLEFYDQLISHSDQALEIFPNQGKLHFFNGCGYLQKGVYDEALASFEQARRLSSSNTALLAEIRGKIGETFHGLGDYQNSDKAFQEALAGHPSHPEVLKAWSLSLAARKTDLENAERMAGELIKAQPDNPVYLDTYARVLNARGKLREAKKVMERAIATGNATATQFEHFGDILYKLGETDAAVVQWEKAQSLNENNELLNKKIANRKIYE